jgi:hypothetical protein
MKAALTSLVLAASETRQYVADIRRDPALKDYKREHQLSTLWANAGMEMTAIDSRLQTPTC